MMLQAIIVFCLTTVTVVFSIDCNCFPEQWEGKKYMTRLRDDQEGYHKEENFISYDVTNQKFAVSGFISSDNTHFQIILDLNTGKAYYILPDVSFCKAYMTTNFHEFCLPATAEYRGDTYLGVDPNILRVTKFDLVSQDATTYLNQSIEIIREYCLPVTVTEYGYTSAYRIFQELRYDRITLGIDNPAVFDPPTYCQEEGILEDEFHGHDLFFEHKIDKLHRMHRVDRMHQVDRFRRMQWNQL